MRRLLLAATTMAVSVVLLNGCSNSATSPHYPIKIVCTTGMVADLVKRVAGPHVHVDQLMGAGVDPHTYKAAPADMSRLEQADMIFYSGLHLEGKMGDVFVRLARKRPIRPVSEGVPKSLIMDVGEEHYDPHIWFDVSLWSEAVQVVADALAEFDPTRSADYRKNAEAYRAELAQLHDECKRELGTIPKERRVLVTAHDAFRYFGRAYDIDVKAIQGISTETEAAVKEINELVDLITERKIKAVFVETSVSPRNVQALVEGCKSRGHDVIVGGELFSDAMGAEGTPEGTYPGMVRHNVKTIVNALK